MGRINRRDFVTGLGACALAGGNWYTAGGRPADSRGSRNLNVLLLLGDGIGWSDPGCYGSTFHETPAIDRLASEGMQFTCAYSASPVSPPSLAAILTGKHPARFHLTDAIPGRIQSGHSRIVTPDSSRELAPGQPAIASVLKESGYASAWMGKWNLGGPSFSPEKHGFDLNIGGNEKASPPSSFGPFDLPGLSGCTGGDQIIERLADEAVKFIQAHRQSPFLLCFSGYPPLLGSRPFLISKFEQKAVPGNPQHNPAYGAMLATFDLAAGRILQAIEDSGLRERTVIIFTSVCGGTLFEGTSRERITSNTPLRAGRGHLYEGGIRVPLIIRWPGVTKRASRCDVPVCGLDIFPTLLTMAGKPLQSDGEDLTPILKRRKFKRRPFYWHFPHYSQQGGKPAAAVRIDDFKLIEFFEDGWTELYDLRQDERERNNIAGDQSQKAGELFQMLKAWREQTGAAVPWDNAGYNRSLQDEKLTGTDPRYQW